MFRITKIARALVAAAFLLNALPSHATTYKVGTGTGCSASTVQAAVDLAVHRSTPSDIYIATNQTYSNQAINITAVSGLMTGINFIGGVPDCKTLQPSGTTSLNGGSNGPVITVRGTIDVKISHLTLTGGHGSSGGGIDYAGVGTLQIDNSTIDSNSATYGGGIRFQGNGGPADLYLNTNTFVTSNTAQSSGGGIRVEGQAAAHIDAPQTWIALNQALGSQGGGLLVVGPATAHIGSPGYLFGGVIYQNTAPYGGGIALISEEAGPATADLVAGDPAKPVRVEQNRATRSGGGVYLLSNGYTQGNGAFNLEAATLTMQGARIDDNAAQEGSGIYADIYYSAFDATARSEVYIGSGAGCGTGVECNSVSGNRAVDVFDHSTSGSAILVQTDGVLKASQLAMRGNEGAHAIRVVDSLHASLALNSCLLADNSLTAELLTLGAYPAAINQCTIAGNANAAEGYAVMRSDSDVTLTNSIVAQGAQQTLLETNGAAVLDFDYVLSGEIASLNGGTHLTQGAPSFVDAGNGDYHLSSGSLGIDVAPPVVGDDRDLDNRPRDQDLPDVPNMAGPRDLGAYERQIDACFISDTVFCNGFEP